MVATIYLFLLRPFLALIDALVYWGGCSEVLSPGLVLSEEVMSSQAVCCALCAVRCCDVPATIK